jgi:hypothetical protein
MLAVVAEVLSGGFKLKNSVKDMAMLMAKYGFLDLEFVAAQQLLAGSDKINSSGLRQLGFIKTSQDPQQKSQLFDNDRACLEVLMEGINEKACFLRVFMSFEPSGEAIKRIIKQAEKERLNGISKEHIVASALFAVADKIHQRLPATFTIEDACLTNSDAIWLAAHEYL